MKEKLKSRKFWLSLALFIYSVIVYIDTRDIQATYNAVFAVIGYVLAEGVADKAKIDKALKIAAGESQE